MSEFKDVYRNTSVLVTGHTGFKGSWLTLWLEHLGAKLTGLSLPPNTSPSHYSLLNLPLNHYQQDIRQSEAVTQILTHSQPQIVFHLAAQPLVRRSYNEPLLTWETNVIGTANLLQACLATPSVKAIVIVTTDKCYENLEQSKGYRESDRLGGYDPYSASKAATEILVSSYRQSFFSTPGSALIATARAGNVIGGGDWSADRLIPDVYRAFATGEPMQIRSPQAVRPWQHVLDSLAGYLLLGQQLLNGNKEFAESWNFGPSLNDDATVSEILNQLQSHWPGFTWESVTENQQHETSCLRLDTSKAAARLGWVPVCNLTEVIELTAQWYQQFMKTGEANSHQQLLEFIARAYRNEAVWTAN